MRIEDVITTLCVFFLVGVWWAGWALLRLRASPPPSPETELQEGR